MKCLNNLNKKTKTILTVIGIIISIMWINNMSTERFSEIDVDHGDIQFYGRDSCPYCVKQKKLLEEVPDLNKKIKHIDTGSGDGAEKFSSIGGEGVPHFECKSTGKSSTGYKQIPDLLSSLGLS